MRIAIAGGPRTGKTTLANSLHRHPLHGDSIMHLGWSETSMAVSKWFDDPGDLVVEGCCVARALRKWLGRNPSGRPVDEVIWCEEPYVNLSQGQETMRKGCVTVMTEILPELAKRGVKLSWRTRAKESQR